ncbi:hypothetical protein O6H91_18G053300 [Diphasiastrum complanatum]|uniref:Uncharacterized protein n=2 Tax=Diphasiastrum complanatum TaxID=34168 RepID=A0ACC2B151_DIPCM|nr:hypothetical protein O6H91_18G052400 [Diphasiastrum complanatum]KAJ7523536.1 hypothetical protein O6H91_18G053300 [Diphasiastrum complanatum]
MEASMSSMSVEGSITSTPIGCFHHGENLEELKHLLVCASMELESVRAAGEAQSLAHEAKVRHLEELLKAACRERDEARQQCFQLQESLSQTGGLELNCINIPSRLSCVQAENPVPLTEENDGRQNFHQDQHCTPLEDQFQVHLKQHHENNQYMLVGQSSALQLQIQQQQNDCMLMGQTAGVALNRELHYQDEKHSQDDAMSLPASIQSNALGLGVHILQPWQIQCSVDDLGNGAREPSLSVDSSVSVGQGSSYFQLPVNATGLVQTYGSSLVQSDYSEPAQSRVSGVTAVSCFAATEMCSTAMAGELSHFPYSANGLPSGSSVLTCIEASNKNFSQQPVHLPEPPEANLHVMLNSLPEKGKLLQAVMQAGPLLQTLLLAGPLPQWRHPPPAINSLEIPKVSMPATPMVVSFKDQISATAPAVNTHDMHMSTGTIPISNQSWGSQISSPLSSVLGTSTNISVQSRMLRTSVVNSQPGEDLKHGSAQKYAKIH